MTTKEEFKEFKAAGIEKVCSKCNNLLTLEHFTYNKLSNLGCRNDCNTCRNLPPEVKRERKAKRIVQVLRAGAIRRHTIHMCGTCSRPKVYTKMHSLSECIECYQPKANAKAVAKRAKEGDLVRAKDRARYAKNTVRYRLTNLKYREAKLSLDLEFSSNDLRLVEDRFPVCFNCGSRDRLELDHHKPLSAGYGLTLNNCVRLCKRCNTSKCDKMPEEFYSKEQLAVLDCILGATQH